MSNFDLTKDQKENKKWNKFDSSTLQGLSNTFHILKIFFTVFNNFIIIIVAMIETMWLENFDCRNILSMLYGLQLYIIF